MSFLKKLEELIGAEKFALVKKELGDKDLIVNDGNYIPKAKFDEKLSEIKTLTESVSKLTTERDEAVNKMKNFEDENSKGKKTIEEQVAALTKQIEEQNKKLAAKDTELVLSKKEIALKDALSGAGVKNPKHLKLLLREFDLNKVELDDNGKVKGFDERVKALQDDYKSLFGEEVIVGSSPQLIKKSEDISEVSSTDFYSKDVFGNKN